MLSNLFLLAAFGKVLLVPTLSVGDRLAHLLAWSRLRDWLDHFNAVTAATMFEYFMMRFAYGGDTGWDTLIKLFDRLRLGQLQSSYVYL